MLRAVSICTSLHEFDRHTGIGIGDIVGTITERGEDESDGRDRKDPIVLCSDCGRHLEPERPIDSDGSEY